MENAGTVSLKNIPILEQEKEWWEASDQTRSKPSATLALTFSCETQSEHAVGGRQSWGTLRLTGGHMHPVPCTSLARHSQKTCFKHFQNVTEGLRHSKASVTTATSVTTFTSQVL